MKKLLLGTLLGAVILFIWSNISWMVIPWHEKQMKKFTDAQAIGDALKANAPEPGLYLLPNSHGDGAADQDWNASVERMSAGPFLFGVVRPGRTEWQFARLMIGSVLIQAAGAFIITALLLTTRLPSYWGRVLFVTTVAGLVGILGHLPAYNWWEFPAGWTFVNIADLVIGWSLGGLALAAVTKPRVNP